MPIVLHAHHYFTVANYTRLNLNLCPDLLVFVVLSIAAGYSDPHNELTTGVTVSITLNRSSSVLI